jgi:hypothetical protein
MRQVAARIGDHTARARLGERGLPSAPAARPPRRPSVSARTSGASPEAQRERLAGRCGLERVPGAELLELLDPGDVGRVREGGAHVGGGVADDGEDPRTARRARRVERPGQQRPSARLVQDLGPLRLHARALARGEHHRDARHGSGDSARGFGRRAHGGPDRGGEAAPVCEHQRRLRRKADRTLVASTSVDGIPAEGDLS